MFVCNYSELGQQLIDMRPLITLLMNQLYTLAEVDMKNMEIVHMAKHRGAHLLAQLAYSRSYNVLYEFKFVPIY